MTARFSVTISDFFIIPCNNTNFELNLEILKNLKLVEENRFIVNICFNFSEKPGYSF